jgi:hypothetical protein
MLMGYACRMTSGKQDVPDDLGTLIESQLIRRRDGKLDNEGIAQERQRLTRLVEYVVTIADDRDAVAAFAGISLGTWEAFCTVATYQLHKNLIGNGMPKRAVPPADLLHSVLRLGYAVRLIDEVAGEMPINRDGQLVPDRSLPAGTALDVDQWLSDATHVCAHDFEPRAERVLELGALGAIGVISVSDYVVGGQPSEPIGDDAVIAVSNARFGYALRNRECQLVTGAREVDGDDPLAAELDRRESGVRHAVLDGLVRDVLESHQFGGADRLYDSTPGTTPDTRRIAIRRWTEQHYPTSHPRTGQAITQYLIEYGYLLHRLFELRPGYFD